MGNGHGLLEMLNRRVPFLAREMPFGRRNVFGDGLVCPSFRPRSPLPVEEPASDRQHHRAGHEADYTHEQRGAPLQQRSVSTCRLAACRTFGMGNSGHRLRLREERTVAALCSSPTASLAVHWIGGNLLAEDVLEDDLVDLFQLDQRRGR